jgi:hypothetical protein
MSGSERFKKKEKTPPEERFEHPEGHIRDRIILNQSPEFTGKSHVVGLNGFLFDIPFGVEVDIPRPVRQMLDTRIRTETIRVDVGNGQMETRTRDIPRLTYRLVKEGINLPEPPQEGALSGADSQVAAGG